MFDFNKWFEVFWNTYPNDLLHSDKGAKRGTWVTKLRKYVNSFDRGREVLESLQAQTEHRRNLKNKGENKTMWHLPAVSVWCNQFRWTVEIPSKQSEAPPAINSTMYQKHVLPTKKEVEQGAVDDNIAALRRSLGRANN